MTPAASPLTAMRIVVVDDHLANLELARGLLESTGYTEVVTHLDTREALERIRSDPPDLIVLDLNMPDLDGFEMLAELRSLILEPHLIPVLVVTGDITPESRRRALSLGARDFVTKPLDAVEVLMRVRNLLQVRHLQLALARRNDDLDAEVRSRTAELEAAHYDTLGRLALAAEYRDDDTHEHALRVGRSSALLAEAVGLSRKDVEALALAAPLHDLGKVSIPDSVLLKQGPLTLDERATIETHTTVGARLLAGGASEVIQLAHDIALTHHERFDGGGYPNGLRGDAIPLPGRIVALADVFDSLTHARPYRAAWPVERARELIRKERAHHFDPRLADLFLGLDVAELLAPIADASSDHAAAAAIA
jgi:response regulator RpfG family c-di-GMP phosphodiesterase